LLYWVISLTTGSSSGLAIGARRQEKSPVVEILRQLRAKNAICND